MGVAGWIMMIAHLGLFFYLRRKYVGKKNKAEKLAAELNAENINLKSQLKSYTELFGS